MARRLTCDVSESVWQAIAEERNRTGESLSSLVDRLLAAAVSLDRHSLFQVSTSSALVKGVFRGATTVAEVMAHGDFGLGTFDGLDGELVLVDGVCYRAGGGGFVTLAEGDWRVPFGVFTRFSPDLCERVDQPVALTGLEGIVDRLRPSANLFVAVRVDGSFEEVRMRAACRAEAGEDLVAATSHQSEFAVAGVDGTLVGFWSPEYAQAVNVPGYHFHFVTGDRTRGGHVLGLRTARCEIAVHVESDLHIAMPETTEFLEADLGGDHAEALRTAERSRE